MRDKPITYWCPRCKGKGKIEHKVNSPYGIKIQYQKCLECEGTGLLTINKDKEERKVMDNVIKATKPLSKVIIKYTGQKTEQIMLFDTPVHVASNMISGHIGLYDESNKCLFLAKGNIVEYIQVAADASIKQVVLCYGGLTNE